MRSASGHISASEVESHVQASKLKDLSAKSMTARDMGLDPAVINLLMYRGVIKKVGKVKVPREERRVTWLNVYAPGPCYGKFCQKRGWV